MDRELEDDLEAAVAVKLVAIVGIALGDSLTLVFMVKVFTAPQVGVVEAAHNDALSVIGHLELDIVVNVNATAFSSVAPFHSMRRAILPKDPQGPETTTFIDLDRLGESEVVLGYSIDGDLLLADALGGIHRDFLHVGRRERKHEAVGYLVHGNQRCAQFSGVCSGNMLEGGFEIDMVAIPVIAKIRNSSVIGGSFTGSSQSVIDCTGWIIRRKVIHEIRNIICVGGEIDGINETVDIHIVNRMRGSRPTGHLDICTKLTTQVDVASGVGIPGIAGCITRFTVRENNYDLGPVRPTCCVECLHIISGLQLLE